MKATEQLFSVVLFFYAVQGSSNFCVCEWNPKVWPLTWKLLSSTFLWYSVYYSCMLHKVVLRFWVCGWNSKVWPLKWKPKSIISTFLGYCLLSSTKGVLAFKSVDESKVWPFKWRPLSSTFLRYWITTFFFNTRLTINIYYYHDPNSPVHAFFAKLKMN